ncbi:hypothetical protein TVAG_322610 [Trichomonas vaginalis G3]|uniref:FAD synthase n=1 Tax=Trichomonas vaginalis (strain ATCC PRA-98 / G3) TaxID=412133 RepID=A2EL13_TRIV3|nr:flavin adenine dinucleotide biosynthetic process [Trichomonas vaginalis G3]EAY06641.1 hypothetical protein TVAG_322610 [Trichomonas vaginalis G3]KAI5552900.1 flavin adenine dinucleotide biosynthetic process [Trichomonas vaginalis G3]|eukprot:XP_001318864.1 hypothetical protein [Trichomonas vaginalis G3]
MSSINGLDAKILSAKSVIKEAFERYSDKLSFCYNGGKDSVVLLDLVMNVVKENNYTIKPFYLEVGDEFDEILDFINYSEKYWGFKLMRIKATNLKEGLEKLINTYQINSVFLGVRADDYPNIKMKPFEPTNNGWPEAERIMPILDWTYNDIWEYIDKFNLPFCSLYNLGYTSIGPKSKTHPNPLLKDPATGEYLHARNLRNLKSERLGRAHNNTS